MRQVQRLGTAFAYGYRLKMTGALQWPERDCARLVAEIEDDPLFLRLARPGDDGERVIRRRRLQMASLSSRCLELKDELVPAGGGAEVESYLVGQERLLELARRVGEENFRTYFLEAEKMPPLTFVAKICGISVHAVRELLRLVNAVGVYGEFGSGGTGGGESRPALQKIAVIAGSGGDGFTINFLSVHWTRGLYEIDHDRLRRLRESGALAAGELKRLGGLLEKLELLNARKSTLYRIIAAFLEKQNAFLSTGGATPLAPLSQKDLALSLGMHPSVVCRALAGRSLEMPWGEELPLGELFRDDGGRGLVQRQIVELLRREAAGGKVLSDREIARRLKAVFGTKIAPRTVAKYRVQMDLGNSYTRRSSPL